MKSLIFPRTLVDLTINIYEILDCKPLSMGYLIPRLVISLSEKKNSHRFLAISQNISIL
jgi:hypothetical protein